MSIAYIHQATTRANSPMSDNMLQQDAALLVDNQSLNTQLADCITAAELNRASLLARESGRSVIEVLQDQLKLSADDFVLALGQALHYPSISIKQIHQLSPAFDVLPFQQASEWGCIPCLNAHAELIVVFADPFIEGFSAKIQEHIGQPLAFYLAHHSDIAAYLSRYEETLTAMDGMLFEQTRADEITVDGATQLSLKSIAEDSSPVIKLVNSTLYDALKTSASDIHLESSALGLTIKYRIDGVLNHINAIAGKENAEQIISRIKVVAELDIAERRIPQDGRFKVVIQQREVDFRVSIMPSVFGEDAVLRILDRKALTEQSRSLTLEHIGIDGKTIAQFRQLVKEPYGMVLVTGPTGSGKTTSLYAALSEVNNGQDKIITIEDPVEYHLSGVLQIPVNEKKGLTFARGLRSILRHDPDKIMVGEIRDAETAQIAVQAALTGHLVFTTVHANNVFDVIGRFINMGVDTYSFVSALNCILAQRLVRLICTHCAEPYQPDADLIERSHISPSMLQTMQFKRGRGCGQCRATGYKGRTAIAELLVMNDELREMIVAREPISQLKNKARAQGLRFLRDAALEKVARGETTLEEINRVTFVA